MNKEIKEIISNTCLLIGVTLSFYFLIMYKEYHTGIDNFLRPVCFLSFGISLSLMKRDNNEKN